MTDTELVATMMVHNAYCQGRANLIDADLTRLAEAYPELLPVLEELQHFREDLD